MARCIRWCRRLALPLFMGLSASIAVAWASAVLVPLASIQPSHEFEALGIEYYWSARVENTRGAEAVRWAPRYGVEWAWANADQGAQRDDFLAQLRADAAAFDGGGPAPAWCHVPESLSGWRRGSGWSFVQVAYGWPWLALQCHWADGPVTADAGGARWCIDLAVGGVGGVWTGPTSLTTAVPRPIPLHPIWGGLLANSAVFAAAWAVVFFAVRRLRTSRRRANTACPKCGYDLAPTGMASGCPECGWGRNGS